MERKGYLVSEFKQLFQKRSVRIAVIFALLVPLVYAMIVLSPKWGPYDNIDNLPVAVVNNDLGAESDGKRVNIGEELVGSLQENQSLGWDFVTSEEAEQGIKDLKYYMVIEVPENFSEKALTVMDDNPEQPELNFTQNEGLHFMAAQVTKNAMELVKNQLSAQITKTYVETVFSQLEEVGDGFQEAADGAEQINDGAEQLKDGSEEILTALTDKSGDISRLADGAAQLQDGTKTMRDSLVSKQGDVNKLAAGAQDLHAGTGELLSNLQGKSGDIGKLADGAQQLLAGTRTLRNSLVSKQGDVNKLAAGASQLHDGTGLLLSNLQGKSDDIGQLADGANQLYGGTSLLQANLATKAPEIGQLAAGAKALSDGTTELKQKLEAGQESVKALANGAKELEVGSETLHAGANQVLSGLNALSAGIDEFDRDVAHGLGQLQRGSTQIVGGLEAAKQQTNAQMAYLKGKLTELSNAAPMLSTEDLQENLNEIISQISDNPGDQLDPLIDGARSLHTNLDPNNSSIRAGLNQLKAGVEQAKGGQTLVVAGAQDLYNGATQIAGGNEQLKNNWVDIIDGVGELNDGATQVAAGNASVNSGWQELLSGATELQSGAKKVAEGNQSVKLGWAELTTGAQELNAGSAQVADGNQTVASGWQELATGAKQLNDGATQVAGGNQTVKEGWNQLAVGAQQLNAGSAQIADGNRTVANGWQELSSGATQLNDGALQVADGNKTVKEGWDTLTDGVSQVDDGLNQLVAGSDELKTGLQGGAERTGELNPTEDNVTMFAEPVVLSGEVINSYPFYRDANAPYILTLALYVGLLVMSIAVPFTRPATMPSSPIAWFAGKVTKLSILAMAQALIIALYSLIVLRIEVQSAVSFILFSLFVSLTFLMIILFLVVLAGNIGRFIALAFVVMQLSTTGSALPVDMLPEGLRNLSVFLPFTYSINGYRNIITLGNNSAIWQSVTVLLLFLLVFAVLSLVVFFWKYRTLRVKNVELVEEAV